MNHLAQMLHFQQQKQSGRAGSADKHFSIILQGDRTLKLALGIALLLCVAADNGFAAEASIASLVPAQPNTSPDYFCTWNIQNYYASYGRKPAAYNAIRERTLFGTGQYENWLGQYSKVHGDLYFLMDEGWDMPDELIQVLPEQFPAYSGDTQPENFLHLVNAVKARGWRGLGLWERSDAKTDSFWLQRLDWMSKSGVSYWKVDYGRNECDEAWRKHLTEMGREHAPSLIIESAMTPHSITWADTYRTYDVDPILSIPQTLGRVVQELGFKTDPPAKSLINCEDEVYMGAALGCCYGVMRHQFAGNLPSGKQDFAFPPVNRDLKRCLDEVVRAVRWHRIAPAFAVGLNAVAVDQNKLRDNWFYQKDESWQKNSRAGASGVEQSPARVARGLPLPEVVLYSGTAAPYVLASRNPNGAISIATLGRTVCPIATDRQWITGENADVTLQVGQNTGPIGIFGHYHSLTLVFDPTVKLGSSVKILAQDLAGEFPVDITGAVQSVKNQIVIFGSVIDRVGLSAATPGDKSEPGLVLVIR